MGINQRKAGAILSYIVLAVNSVIGILYTPIMLRLMGQSEYGLYSLVASVIGYLTMFDLGLGNAMIRYIAKYKAIGDKKSEAKLNGMFFVIYTIIGVIVLLIGLVLSSQVELIFSNSLTGNEIQKAKILFTILTLNLAVSFPLGIFSSILTAYEEFVFSKLITLGRTILMPVIMIPMLLAGYRSIGMVVVISVLNLAGLLMNTWYCLRKLEINMALKGFDFAILRDVAPYSFYIFLNIVVDKLYVNTDKFILGSVSGTIAVSVYAIALQLYEYYSMFSTSINGVFLPKLTAIAAKDRNADEELSEVFVRIGRIQFIILSFILSGFILYGRTFLNLWAGEGYSDAYYISLLIMIPAIIPLSQNIGILILQAKNMHRFRSVVYILIAIVNVLISIPLAKLYGGVGAALGTALANLAGQICTMNWYYYKKVGINIPGYWKQIGRLSILVLLIMTTAGALDRYISGESWIILMGQILIYCFLFTGLMWKFGMNQYERGLVRSIISRVTGKGRSKVVYGDN